MSGLVHPAVMQARRDTGSCPLDIVWPTLTGWTAIQCWKTGPHDIHTDSHGAPLCTTEEAAWMGEQYRLATDGARRELGFSTLLI